MEVIEQLNVQLQEQLIQKNAVENIVALSNIKSVDRSSSIIMKNGMEPKIVGVG